MLWGRQVRWRVSAVGQAGEPLAGEARLVECGVARGGMGRAGRGMDRRRTPCRAACRRCVDVATSARHSLVSCFAPRVGCGPVTQNVKFRAALREYARAARAAGLVLRIDETNNIAQSGTFGVSNTLGSALWLVIHALGVMQTGVDGINVHGAGCTPYSPVLFPGVSVHDGGWVGAGGRRQRAVGGGCHLSSPVLFPGVSMLGVGGCEGVSVQGGQVQHVQPLTSSPG